MRIALIGYGYWGPNVARNLANNPRIDLAAICEKKPDRLAKARCVFFEQTRYVENFHDLLEDSSIQGVAVAVETSAHFEVAREVLLAGKHLYIEKPFTSTVAEAEKLAEIAREKGLVIHVDHIMVFHPIIKRTRALLDDGSLGNLLYFDASRLNLGQIKHDVSAMWDLAIHDLAIVDFLTNGKEPFRVSAMGERLYSRKETLTFLTLRYDGFIAHMKSSWISPLKERRLIIACDKKMVVFDDMQVDTKMMIYDKGVDVISEPETEYKDYVVKTRTGEILVPNIPQQDALFNSIDHFVTCCESNSTSICGSSQAIRLGKILEEASRQLADMA